MILLGGSRYVISTIQMETIKHTNILRLVAYTILWYHCLRLQMIFLNYALSEYCQTIAIGLNFKTTPIIEE